jgi:hypothetical protein
MLYRESLQNHNSHDTRASAVMAVSRLYDKAVPLVSFFPFFFFTFFPFLFPYFLPVFDDYQNIPVLLHMLEKGSVNRDILANAIRNCGEAGMDNFNCIRLCKLIQIKVKRHSSLYFATLTSEFVRVLRWHWDNYN